MEGTTVKFTIEALTKMLIGGVPAVVGVGGQNYMAHMFDPKIGAVTMYDPRTDGDDDWPIEGFIVLDARIINYMFD